MKQWLRSFLILWACLVPAVISGCQQVAITGRRQLTLVPDSLVNNMAMQEYNAFLQSPETRLSTDPQKTAMVQRVGMRIADAVERYAQEEGIYERISGYQWEFNLVESDQRNAWAMPGGKVVVYTGLLDIAQTEDQLAVVIGHEIAHVVARHGNERMSQGLLVSMGGLALSQAMRDQPDRTRQLLMTSYGIGATVGVMLPYSRMHEREADHLGLIFMAMAGYNPEAALTFWENMMAQREGPQMPEFLSTHPAGQTRIDNINEFLPEAREIYRRQTGRTP